MYGSRYATARFIARALLTTCGRNIFPEPKRSPTIFIPSISGPSMTSSGRAAAALASSVSSSMKSTIPCTSACASRSPTGASRQERSSSRCGRAACHRPRALDEPLRRVRAAVEEHVLDPLEQVGLDVLVDGELARVDDPHVEPCADRVVEERRVHRLADGVVPAEGEGEVRDAARDERPWAPLLEQWDRLDERTSRTARAPRSRWPPRARSGRGRCPRARNPASPIRRSYARPRISTFRSTVSACPCSSNAMTTTPAP